MRLLYPARLYFKIEEEIKTFEDKCLRELMTTRTALQKMLMRFTPRRKRKIVTIMIACEITNLIGGVDTQMRNRKESNITSKIKYETTEMSKKRRNEQRMFKITKIKPTKCQILVYAFH